MRTSICANMKRMVGGDVGMGGIEEGREIMIRVSRAIMEIVAMVSRDIGREVWAMGKGGDEVRTRVGMKRVQRTRVGLL